MRYLVVVAGNAGHGKDTFSDLLAQEIPGATRDAFAAPLKLCVHFKTGIPLEVLNGPQSVKNSVEHGAYGQTPRRLMRDEGEEARQRIGKTVWMDRLAERFLAGTDSVRIVSDGRHPEEEMLALRARLVASEQNARLLLVRIVRPSVLVDRSHISESAVADAPDTLFDRIVLNVGSIDELREHAKRLAYDLSNGLS